MELEESGSLTSDCTTKLQSTVCCRYRGLPWWLGGKESACNTQDMGSVPGSGRSPGEGNGNSLQDSYLGNFMDRGAWQAFMG